jgi:DNA-binding FadR family transcriptional regulator
MIFNQIRHGRISDNIVAQIKNAIFTGMYKPGDKLPSEAELKSLFNVSRVPLREALRSMEEMGLITIKAGVSGGAFVAQMGIKSVSDSLTNMMRLGKIGVADIWAFRLLIEPSMSRLSATERTDWDIEQMEYMVSVREKAVKARRAPVIANIDFHQAIARSTQNPLVILVMDAVSEILGDHFKRFTFSLSDHQSINKFHRQILECLKDRDAKKVGEIMQTHLIDVKNRLKI